MLHITLIFEYSICLDNAWSRENLFVLKTFYTNPISISFSIDKNSPGEILDDPVGMGCEKKLLESGLNTIGLTNRENIRINAQNKFLV